MDVSPHFSGGVLSVCFTSRFLAMASGEPPNSFWAWKPLNESGFLLE